MARIDLAETPTILSWKVNEISIKNPHSIRENLMSEHSHSDRPDLPSERFRTSSPSGREDNNRARQAAEALFAPKRSNADPSTAEDIGSAQQHSRKPRVLSAVTAMTQPRHEEPTKPPLRHKPRRQRKRVPVSQIARLRTWVNYGMTVHQASDMYGVSVTEIERILQKA